MPVQDKDERPPVPDPTLMTTRQIIASILALRELIDARLGSLDGRVAAIEERIHQRVAEIAGMVDEKTGFVKVLHEEKFRSIQVQFTERDTRAEQTSRDSKVAVDAALQAAKEAVGEQNRSSALAIAKSEAATMKQIDQQGTLLQTATGALDGKIGDVKDRITTLEGRSSGVAASWAVAVTLVGLLIAILGLALRK